jgi:hypothetical protein
MASVEVFVDDAVRGTLPNVCVKTGEIADGPFRIEQGMGGGLGAAWLLVLLGPIGWILLVVVAASSRRSVLTVRLPYSEAAVDRELRLSRQRGIAIAVAVVLGFAALVRLASIPGLVWWGGAIAAVAVAAVIHVRLKQAEVGIRLDASGRWVTLSRVHPGFAHAVNATRDTRSRDSVAND